jgi:hypothetical protein
VKLVPMTRHRTKGLGDMSPEEELFSAEGLAAYEALRLRSVANQAVHRAVRSGVLVRQPCFCGTPGEAHHSEGYSVEKQLAVTWLCKRHHRAAHKELRRTR